MLLKFLLDSIPSASYSALVVVGDTAALTSTDSGIISLLTNLGYAATTINGGVVTTGDATGHDVVIVSFSAPGSVGNTLQTIPEPLISCYTPVSNNAEISDSANNGYAQTAINIVDNSHPITTGLSLGDLTIFASTDQIAYAADAGVGAGATVLAERSGDATVNALFLYDSGDTLTDASAASGKRVFTWITDSSFDFHTTAANDLMKKVIQWASGEI